MRAWIESVHYSRGHTSTTLCATAHGTRETLSTNAIDPQALEKIRNDRPEAIHVDKKRIVSL